MYKPLLVYVSVSLNSQWGVTAHDNRALLADQIKLLVYIMKWLN